MASTADVDEAPWAGYRTLDRAEWAALREATPMSLGTEDLHALRGLNEHLDQREVTDVYLPLSRLLNLRVAATQALQQTTDTFLGRPHHRTPFIIGLGGSVAVGKSTTARVLQALLARWPDHPNVELVTTDGFLLPNAVLEERGIMDRKGFPESYDVRALMRFLDRVKRGDPEAKAPVYSHVIYDIVEGEEQVLDAPDIVIVEGLNVLQTGRRPEPRPASSPTGSTSRSSSTPTRATSSSGSSHGSSPCARRPSATRPRSSATSPPSPTTSCGRRPTASGRRSTVPTSGRTSCRAGGAPTSSSTRPPTTPFGASGSASGSDPSRPQPLGAAMQRTASWATARELRAEADAAQSGTSGSVDAARAAWPCGRGC